MPRRSFRYDEMRAARASRFASELADALHELRVTHKALARELGVTHHTIDSWTRATDPKIPGQANLDRLCDLLDHRKPGLGVRLASAAGGSWKSSATASDTAEPLRPAAETPRSNLPHALASFVGRNQEIAEITQLLRSARLLTLMGTGGIGKTRLALQVAIETSADFADGVWLVELASLTDPHLLEQTIAASLQIREQPGHTVVSSIVEHLRPKQMLLVLDNCEHLVDACAQLVASLLQASPRLVVLATSREALQVRGEVIWRVPPLSLPPVLPADTRQRAVAQVEQLESYEAVRLFVERARSHNPRLGLTEHGLVAVAEICRRLDGVPLAIELAAAGTRTLSVEQIKARLDDRFGLLTDDARNVAPRHRTLRAALDWSYDLLSEPERKALRGLAIFAATWSLEAHESFCSLLGVSVEEGFHLLRQLVDKSLVLVEQHRDQARYRMLETIRAYARERLHESGEYEAAKHWHTSYYSTLAKAAESGLDGAQSDAWIERLTSEYDNVRAALDEALRTPDGETAGYMVLGLRKYWDRLGYASEGLSYLEAAIALGEGVRDEIRAQIYNAAGIIAYNKVDYGRAAAFYERSMELARKIGDERRVAGTLNNLGLIAKQRRDYARAEVLFREYLEMQRQWGDRKRVAMALCNLSNVPMYQGDYERARALCEESVQIFRELEDEFSVSVVAEHLGVIALRQGDYERAMMWFEKHRAGQLERQARRSATHALKYMGIVMLRKGEAAKAESLFSEALATYQELAAKAETAECLAGLAVVAAMQEPVDLWRAGVLLGASQVLLDSAEKLVPPNEAEYRVSVAVVHEIAEAKPFDLTPALQVGRSMPIEQVLAYATARSS